MSCTGNVTSLKHCPQANFQVMIWFFQQLFKNSITIKLWLKTFNVIHILHLVTSEKWKQSFPITSFLLLYLGRINFDSTFNLSVTLILVFHCFPYCSIHNALPRGVLLPSLTLKLKYVCLAHCPPVKDCDFLKLFV